MAGLEVVTEESAEQIAEDKTEVKSNPLSTEQVSTKRPHHVYSATSIIQTSWDQAKTVGYLRVAIVEITY